MMKWVAQAPKAQQEPNEPRPVVPVPGEETVTTREEVRQAWEEWQAAVQYFENVSDPDLVDYAIYQVEAARRRYAYMLKHVRPEN